MNEVPSLPARVVVAHESRALFALMAINFVGLVGFGLMLPVFASYGRQIEATGAEIAGAVAMFSLGQLISSSIWGRLSDRYGRRRVLLVSMVAGAVVFSFHLLAVTPEILLAVRFLSGLASGSVSVTFAIASDISTRETRTKVMGVVGAGFSLGFIFGPAIGGVVASLAPEGQAFALVCIVGSVLAAGAAALCWLLLPETRKAQAAHARPATSRGQLLAVPEFRAIVIITFCAIGAFAQMEAVLALFADDVLGLEPFGIGLLFGSMGVVSTLMQLSVTGRAAAKLGERRLLQISLAIQGVGVALLGLSTTVPMALFALLFVSVSFGLVNPALSSLTSLTAPADAQGTAQGIAQSASAFGRVVGPALAGVLYDALGPASPLLCGGALLLAIFVLMPVLVPRSAVAPAD